MPTSPYLSLCTTILFTNIGSSSHPSVTNAGPPVPSIFVTTSHQGSSFCVKWSIVINGDLASRFELCVRVMNVIRLSTTDESKTWVFREAIQLASRKLWRHNKRTERVSSFVLKWRTKKSRIVLMVSIVMMISCKCKPTKGSTFLAYVHQEGTHQKNQDKPCFPTS